MSKNPRENPPEDEIGQIHQLGSDTIFNSQNMIIYTRKLTRELTNILCVRKKADQAKNQTLVLFNCWLNSTVKGRFLRCAEKKRYTLYDFFFNTDGPIIMISNFLKIWMFVYFVINNFFNNWLNALTENLLFLKFAHEEKSCECLIFISK